MAAIGAGFRIEELDDRARRGAKTVQHRCDHMIVADQDAIRLDLRFEMTIADMPGERCQMASIARTDFEQSFRLRP